MRYTDEQIYNSLKQTRVVLEDYNAKNETYFDNLDRAQIYVSLVNAPKEDQVMVESISNTVRVYYTIDLQWGRFGLHGATINIHRIDGFDIEYSVLEPGMKEAHINEEQVEGTSVKCSYSCKSFPCELTSVDLTVTIDYESNKILNVEAS